MESIVRKESEGERVKVESTVGKEGEGEGVKVESTVGKEGEGEGVKVENDCGAAVKKDDKVDVTAEGENGKKGEDATRATRLRNRQQQQQQRQQHQKQQQQQQQMEILVQKLQTVQKNVKGKEDIKTEPNVFFMGTESKDGHLVRQSTQGFKAHNIVEDLQLSSASESENDDKQEEGVVGRTRRSPRLSESSQAPAENGANLEKQAILRRQSSKTEEVIQSPGEQVIYCVVYLYLI